MSKFGDDLIKNREEALAHARGEPSGVRTTCVLISGQDLMDVMQRSPHKEIDFVPLGFPMPVRDVEL